MANENLARPVTTGESQIFIAATHMRELAANLHLLHPDMQISPDVSNAVYDLLLQEGWRAGFSREGNLTGIEYIESEWTPTRVQKIWQLFSDYAILGSFIEYSEMRRITPYRLVIKQKRHLAIETGWYGFGAITIDNAKSRT